MSFRIRFLCNLADPLRVGRDSNVRLLASKGQIISKCPYAIIVYPKIASKKFPRFLP